jgi:E2/UBC family protein E
MSGNGQTQLLPESDREFLDEKGYVYDVQQAGDVFVTIRDFTLPETYSPRSCTLLLKLPAGYPNANPDMFWTAPNVRLVGGGVPVAAEVVEVYMNQSWQRWSRHTNTWRAGIDNIQTKLRAVVSELAKGR